MLSEPAFMAYELRLLWHAKPDFYAILAVFIGGGGGLQYIDIWTNGPAATRSQVGSGGNL